MENNIVIDGNLFCCLSKEQQEEIKRDIENQNMKKVYHYQENLIKEKTGYCCGVCGACYPYLRMKYKDELIAPEDISKLEGELKKYKKAATFFCDNHYYAQNKKTLLKFEPDVKQNMQQTDVIPIMGDVYHTIMSQDEKYIATENFKGTLGIVDACTKQMIAKKQKCKINGSFIFSEDDNLLYFFEDTIRCWNFIENKEEIIWKVPEEWKLSGDNEKTIHVVCNNVIYNGTKHTYLFQCVAGEITYVVVIKDKDLDEVVQLPDAPVLCRLVYVEERNQYTLVSEGKVNIYDEHFNSIENFAYPDFIHISDGGGYFPVTIHESDYPHRIFLSPDGKWILLDYFTSVILMKHENYEIKYCLFSYTGRTAQNMGFVDSKHFWYTWGDTTYIREIVE